VSGGDARSAAHVERLMASQAASSKGGAEEEKEEEDEVLALVVVVEVVVVVVLLLLLLLTGAPAQVPAMMAFTSQAGPKMLFRRASVSAADQALMMLKSDTANPLLGPLKMLDADGGLAKALSGLLPLVPWPTVLALLLLLLLLLLYCCCCRHCG